MSLILKKAIFVNRAPFNHIELDFMDSGVNVLSAINGRGKTTILSHVVDALYELAKPYFMNEFEDKSNKYYRVSSSVFNINMSQASYVYLRFVYKENEIEENWDYIDIRNRSSAQEYNSQISLEDKIPFAQFSRNLQENGNIKHWSQKINKEKVHNAFSKNLLTYFPSYRYETPGYLNNPYNFKIEHKIDSGFSGHLSNPIESFCLFKDIANWLLDVFLDNIQQLFEMNTLGQELLPYISKANPKDVPNLVMSNPKLLSTVYRLQQNVQYMQSSIVGNVNTVFTHALSSKYTMPLKLHVGSRALGGIRINVVNEKNENEIIYPSIFNMSSGEKALVAIFVELLRQMDNLHIKIEDITGIVLIDEIEKNLHIKMQHAILPKLFKMFPNVQFIVSSHSPFLNMGLADEMRNRAQIIDLDSGGIVCEPTNNDMYREVYEMMVSDNQRFADRYHQLVRQINENAKPLIITEGKTDYRHIKNAMWVLGRNDIDVDFFEVPDNWGSSKLKEMLESISKIKQGKIIIGIFDRDESDYLSYLDVDNQRYKSYGDSNVYAFAIPLVNEAIYGNEISIEHYYKKEDLLKEDANHRRLFLGSEFYKSGNSKDGRYQTKISQIQHKVKVNGIIDEKVYESSDLEQLHSIALAKDTFTKLIESDGEYGKDFDFSNFNQIIDVIQEIIGIPLK